MSDRRCAACGTTKDLRRVEDGIWLCRPDPPPKRQSCWDEWNRGRGNVDEIEYLRRRAFAIVRTLGFDSQDRRMFTSQVFTNRGPGALSWSSEAQNPLTLTEWRLLVAELHGAEVAVEMYRKQHMPVTGGED